VSRQPALWVCALAVAAVASEGGAAPTPVRCTPLGTARVALTVTPPSGRPLVGVKIALDYPPSVGITGLADQPSVVERVRGPDGFLMSPNDTDEGQIIFAIAGTKALPAGRLVTVEFDRCEGMAPAREKDFACKVVEGADEANALLRDGMRCSVELLGDKEGSK
jgi:hypothetical protein